MNWQDEWVFKNANKCGIKVFSDGLPVKLLVTIILKRCFLWFINHGSSLGKKKILGEQM